MTEITDTQILEQLPYQEPFLFVDHLSKLNLEGVEGYYTFREESDFYRGHFKGSPVTPGVLLTECCAQIGLACLGLYLINTTGDDLPESTSIGLTEAKMEFLHPVYPGEKVRVTGEKQYFRFNKLKVSVKLFNQKGVLACRGEVSGMFQTSPQ